MIDAIALDITPVSGPSYFREYRDNGRTPLSDRSKSHTFDATKVQAKTPVLIVQGTVQTQTVAELVKSGTEQRGVVDDVAVAADPAVAAKNVRSTLLAKKYAGKTSREDNARLDILTERIRLLSPRVTNQEVDLLVSIVDQAEAMSANLEDIRTRYGI
jgi:hypothetical protein